MSTLYLQTFIEKVKILLRKKVLKVIFVILILLLALLLIPGITKRVIVGLVFENPEVDISDSIEFKKAKEKLVLSITGLNKKLEARIPKTHYLIINTASNEFSLYKGKTLLKKDKCSTGSYVLLKNGDQQQWMFKTPKGEFNIRAKTTSPVWKKPDWAFVEEGLPIPTANHFSRFEYGVLGDYALSLGDGYLIHGTLYQRFLGLPVTHGCVRLNDENLELVYNSLNNGSKVYIY